MRVLLIVGGWSSEREVSLRGGKGIAAALEERGHRVTWFDLQDGFDSLTAVATQHEFCFINLHGSPGEDGLVQALLDACHCPYQGSGPAGSFLALHKAGAKQLFRRAGLLTADWQFIPTRPPQLWEPSLPYPLFVKSNTGGSSLHLSRANNKAELDNILDEIFNSGAEAILEPLIDGIEITCGVLGDQALPPILIQPVAGAFFDYTSKYAAGGANELCPAPIDPALTQEVQELALRAHKTLGLRGYSRSDFILTPDNQFYLLETNTLPGMTGTSLVPQEAAVIGLDFGDLLEKLMELGMEFEALPQTPQGD